MSDGRVHLKTTLHTLHTYKRVSIERSQTPRLADPIENKAMLLFWSTKGHIPGSREAPQNVPPRVRTEPPGAPKAGHDPVLAIGSAAVPGHPKQSGFVTSLRIRTETSKPMTSPAQLLDSTLN